MSCIYPANDSESAAHSCATDSSTQTDVEQVRGDKATSKQHKALWREFAVKYEHPDHRSWMGLLDTLIPLFVGWYLMYRCLPISYGLTLLLAVPTGLFY